MRKKNIVRVTENELKKYIKESIKKVLKENYYLDSIDELVEYMWLKPNITGLNVDIFVDDGFSYERHEHELLLFVRNGYDRNISEFIPVSISLKPRVLNDIMDFHISYDDIFDVQDFIICNLSILKALANNNISQLDFVKSIRKPSFALQESKKILLEMSTLKKEDSGLPMDIWLDEGATYRGHAPRLKFRASNEQRTTREYSSMLLTNPPTIENMPDNSPLRNKDIDKLKKFIINNLDLLVKLANGEIDYISDFLPNMKI